MTNRGVFARAAAGTIATLTAVAGLATTAAPAAADQRPDVVADLAREALGALHGLEAVRNDPARQFDFVETAPDVQELANRYTYMRTLLAQEVGARAGVAPEAVDAAWQDTSVQRMTVVLTALTEVGTSYRWGRSSPGVGFDCSGLTSYAWSSVGVGLVRQSGSQIRSAHGRDQASAEPGDLVWYPGHIMLYLGAGEAVVHAPNSGSRVEVDDYSRAARFASPLVFG